MKNHLKLLSILFLVSLITMPAWAMDRSKEWKGIRKELTDLKKSFNEVEGIKRDIADLSKAITERDLPAIRKSVIGLTTQSPIQQKSKLAILEAVRRDDRQRVEKLLKKDPELVNKSDERGVTPLITGVARYNEEMCALLLNRGANPNAQEMRESTALLLVVTDNQIPPEKQYALSKLLVDHGADMTKLTSYGISPLIAVVAKGRDQICKLFLDSGANPNLKDGVENSVLSTALDRGQIKIVQMLIRSGADTTCELLDAVQEGRENAVVTLLVNKANVNKTRADGFTPLMVAAQNGHTKIAQILLSRGADIDARIPGKFDDITALSLAVENGKTEVVKLLLDKGADIDGGRFVGIADLCLLALSKGHMEIYNMLSEAWGEI